MAALKRLQRCILGTKHMGDFYFLLYLLLIFPIFYSGPELFL